MFVPSHDERDYEFAKKNGLDFKRIIETDEEFYD
jgi:leucyl-tRNA synthetase